MFCSKMMVRNSFSISSNAFSFYKYFFNIVCAFVFCFAHSEIKSNLLGKGEDFVKTVFEQNCSDLARDSQMLLP